MFDIMAHIEGPTFEIGGTIYGRMVVTKEVAEEIKANAYEAQRNMNDRWASAIARDMSNGVFHANNGQTMVFDEDGHQIDGQHRTQSVIDTGVTEVFPVAVVKREVVGEMFASLDNNMKRQTSLYMSGPNKAARTVVATTDFCIRYGVAPLLSVLQGKATGKTQATRAEVVKHNNDNEDYITAVTKDAARLRRAVGKGSFAAFGAFVLIVKYCQTDELIDEFVNDFTRPVPDSKTVQACVTSILRQYASGKAPSVKWVFGTLLDAYEHYRALDDSTMFNKQNKRIADYDKMMQAMRARD